MNTTVLAFIFQERVLHFQSHFGDFKIGLIIQIPQCV